MEIIYYKNRGAVVSNPLLFISKYRDAIIIDSSLVVNITVLDFSMFAEYKGLYQHHWAWFWLNKKDKRAKEIGTNVPIESIKQETSYSKNELEKIHGRETRINTRDVKRKERTLRGVYSNARIW